MTLPMKKSENYLPPKKRYPCKIALTDVYQIIDIKNSSFLQFRFRETILIDNLTKRVKQQEESARLEVHLLVDRHKSMYLRGHKIVWDEKDKVSGILINCRSRLEKEEIFTLFYKKHKLRKKTRQALI